MELLDLVARWIHVIAGIMWVGNSMLFNWLDRNLQQSAPGAAGASAGATAGATSAGGRIGDIWLLHSGAFYYVEKTLLGGRALPMPLHWFKWQAYTTWLSGAALLIVVYYVGGRAVLAGEATAPRSHGQVVALATGAVVLGWALYESMQQFVAPRVPMLAAAVWMTGLAGIAVALTHLLDGKAAFLHTGAMLGTIMASNVFFTIIPSQRELVASVVEGRGACAIMSARAKRVSIHNNYFTLPVVVLMVSGHFPTLYGNRFNWMLLLLAVAIGASIRHILNIRFTLPTWKPRLGALMLGGVSLLYVVEQRGEAGLPAPTVSSAAPATFTDVRRVIDRRCSACHSAEPSDVSLATVPANIRFDSPEQIGALSARIMERAVVTRTMPPANKTRITDAERALLARWIAHGASTK